MTIRFAGGHVAASGEEIYYEVAGDGDDVVVLGHGLGGNHAVWFQQVPVFAEHYRVVTWDQRGLRYVVQPLPVRPGPRRRSMTSTRCSIIVGVERAHLVGQSMGGWAVVGFALRSPERVRSLVLADTTAGSGTKRSVRPCGRPPHARSSRASIGAHPAVGPAFDRTQAFLYQQLGGFRSEIDERT